MYYEGFKMSNVTYCKVCGSCIHVSSVDECPYCGDLELDVIFQMEEDEELDFKDQF